MADLEHVTAIKENLATLKSHDPTTIGTDGGLGDVNFKSSQRLFQDVHRLSSELDSLPFEALPTAGINWGQLAQFTQNISTTLAELAAFTLKGRANPENERDGLVNKLAHNTTNFSMDFCPISHI